MEASEKKEKRREYKFHYHPAALGKDVMSYPLPYKPRPEPAPTPSIDLAPAEYKVETGWDPETGDETLTVTGKITAPTEMTAKTKLAELLAQAREDGKPPWNEDTDMIRSEAAFSSEDGKRVIQFNYGYRRNPTDFGFDPAKEALKSWIRWVGITIIIVGAAALLGWLLKHRPDEFRALFSFP